jgi:hypothetical protein
VLLSLTYVRREWGHGADPVHPDAITRARAECADRTLPFAVEETKTVPGRQVGMRAGRSDRSRYALPGDRGAALVRGRA